jgi:hypothetical protein
MRYSIVEKEEERRKKKEDQVNQVIRFYTSSLSQLFFSVCFVISVCFVVALPLSAHAQPIKTKPAITFENAIERSGINFILDNSRTPDKHQIETMMAGVAVFDFDNDDRLDIYFANGAALPSFDKSAPKFFNRLYRNKGDGTFADVTEKAGVRGKGYAMGVATGDYDNDGFVDLYVTGVNHNQLFRNNGDGTFSDATEKANVTSVIAKYGKTYAVSAGWFDFDNDGWLDLFVVNYLEWKLKTAPLCKSKDIRAYCNPTHFAGQPNILYRNNHDGTFTNVSESSGIGQHIGKGMGVAFADYNGDGFSDVFVANDTFRNYLFENQRNGTFKEIGILSGVAFNENGKSIAGMGVDLRDVNNDGKPDAFVTAMIGDTFPLYQNLGNQFADVTNTSGLTVPTIRLTAWGNGVIDFDNDGWKDLFAACGAILDNAMEIEGNPYPLPNLLLRNLGKGQFVDVSKASGVANALPHRGAAFGDFNNDGRVDIVTTNLNAKPELFLNRPANAHHWLIVKLIGSKSNRDGLGAKLKLTTGKLTQFNHATTSVGYSSASDKRVYFGLGANAIIDRLEITWPSGAQQTLTNVKANHVLTVKEDAQ